MRLQPQKAFWRYLYADQLRRVGQLSKAEELLLELCRSPESVSLDLIETRLGELYETLGRYDEAEALFRNAIDSAPHEAYKWVFLAALLQKMGRLDEARELFERAPRNDRLNDEICLNLGLGYRATGTYRKAKEFFERALSLDPQYSSARKALDDVTEAIQVVDDLGSVAVPGTDSEQELIDRMWRAFEQEHWAACLELVKHVMRRQPNKAFWRYLYADQLRRVGQFAKAEELLLELFRAPESVSLDLIETCLGELYETLGRYDEAEAWFRNAIDSAPDEAYKWVLLAALLQKMGRLDEARQLLERAPRDDNLDEIYLNLGLGYRATGDYRKAKEFFERALSLDPQYSSARKALDDVTDALQVVDDLGSVPAPDE